MTFGLEQFAGATKTIKGLLPHAGVGANFSPQMDYVGDSFQFVECFRVGCLTMPWSEDYVWSVPLGTQQMMGIRLDMFRAGLRHKPVVAGTQDHKILMYVMGHSPGQSRDSWRRQFYNDISHGMKIVDLYSFRSNWCSNNQPSHALRATFLLENSKSGSVNGTE